MKKKSTRKKKSTPGPKTKVSVISVPITKKTYGRNLQGLVVAWEGYDEKVDEKGNKLPKPVDNMGSFQMGKNILESMQKTLKSFSLKISKIKQSAIRKVGKEFQVVLSDSDYSKMKQHVLEENADIKNDIIRKKFAELFPRYYKTSASSLYRAGTLERIIPESGLVSLSVGDKARVRTLYSSAILSGLTKKGVSSLDIAREKAIFDISTLEAYADSLEKKIGSVKTESDWQDYIREHILNLKEEYIAKEEKVNISIGRTSFPDFLLINQDMFLDVLEIKTPATPLVSYDNNHQNYYMSSELMKAIAQTEKYIDQVSSASLELERYLSKSLRFPFGVVRPGGLIIVGSEKGFEGQKDPAKAKEDFRRLRGTFKNVRIITYTELLMGLRNRITILKQLQAGKAGKKKSKVNKK